MSIEHELQAAALDYVNRGWALTWIDYGKKFPEHPAWNTPGEVVTTPEAARHRWNGTARNIGLVHGLGAVKTCSLDVDQVEHTRAALAEFGIDLEALRQGVPTVIGNPANFRLLYRQPNGLDLPLFKLEWPAQDGKGKVTIFELRAGPNQDVLPPSLHPNGHPYRWAHPLPADATAMPEPPAALLELWRNWLAWEPELKAACPWAKPAEPKAKPHRKGDGARLDIIGPFNAAHDVRELLEANGYQPRGKNRYLPPNSKSGVPSVRILESGKVYSSNGSCPLNDGHGHDAFGVFTILEHAGDVRAAVKAAAELLGIELNPQQKSKATPPPDGAADDPRPQITVERGSIAPMLEATERALIESCPDLYQRAGMLTRTTRIAQDLLEHGFKRPAGTLALLPVTGEFLLWRMNQSIEWIKDGPTGPRPTDAPSALARMLLDLAGYWQFPYLNGVIECPTLRRDGTVLIREGYDSASGLYLDSGGMEFDPIPDRPTKTQAERAMDDLRDVLKDFPYEEPQDRAVTLSGILTVPVRHRLPTAPLHGHSATRPGSGKSLQVDIPALIATGRPAPAMSQATDETEEEKRLVGILLSGTPLALIDNVNRPLGSDRLCSVLTQQTYKGRMLGLNKNPELPCRLTWFATGNALTLMDDMNDRAIMGFLSPATERPEQQAFDRDLYQWIPEQRHRLASAVLTVLRHYVVQNFPDQKLTPFVRFNEWSRLVRGALVYLGEADPVLTQERLRDRDPVRTGLGALLEAWHAEFNEKPMLVNEVAATENRELRAALQEVASRDGDKINSKSLSHYLRKFAGRAEGGLKLVAHKKDGHTKLGLWRVVPAKIFYPPPNNAANAANPANSPPPPPPETGVDCGISGVSGVNRKPVENFSPTCITCIHYSPTPDFDGGTCSYHESAVDSPDTRTCERWEAGL